MAEVSDEETNDARGSWVVRGLSRWFGGSRVGEVVATRIHLQASADAIWNAIMFFEEIPGRPPFPLRLVMPFPVRTEGGKAKVGANVLCVYTTGELIKRMTAIEPPYALRFEVLEQRLGIEGCGVADHGSYEIVSGVDGCDLIVRTRYWAMLHPRWLWRPLERLVMHQLHRHVLNGMREALSGQPEAVAAASRSL